MLSAVGALALVITLGLAGSEVSAQGSCLGAGVTISGTPGNDVIAGTPGDDVIDTFGGDDQVAGGEGDDRICLGSGVDVAQGGNGADLIEGGTEDDLVVGDHLSSTAVGTGDDEVAGGDGHDVVIGDVSNEVGTAAGEGDDKVNGGAGTDVVLGDAYSSSAAAGTGEDDVDAGPGSDVVSGDVLVGDPTGAPPPRGGDGVDVQAGEPVGAGAGGDEVNTQTGDDLVVGDALTFTTANAAPRGLGFEFVARLFCGKRLVRQVLRKQFQGMSQEEIDDFVEETLKAEFDGDFVIGDCANLRPLRSEAEIDEARTRRLVNGGGPDSIKSGNEGSGQPSESPGGASAGDVVFGGSFGLSGLISGDNDSILLGKGDDIGFGDGGQPDFSPNGAIPVDGSTFFAFSFDRTQPIPPTADFNADGAVDAADYTVWRRAFGAELATSNRRAADGRRGGGGLRVDGGGKDQVRGGSGDDQLDGGPRRDECKGGGGGDDDAQACEKETGIP